MTTIGLIDYGAGNVTSVRNALDYLHLDNVEVRSAEQFDKTTHLILPGVGAFASAMRRLEALRLADELKEQVLIKKKPFLGICVGMQLLATVGHEFEVYPGLGFVKGSVVKIDAERHGRRLPHIGWNELSIRRPSHLFAHLSGPPIFYFVHSYHLQPHELDVIAAVCDYGDQVVAAVELENIYGVQFHPEKSQRDGLRLLKDFAAISH